MLRVEKAKRRASSGTRTSGYKSPVPETSNTLCYKLMLFIVDFRKAERDANQEEHRNRDIDYGNVGAGVPALWQVHRK